MKLAFIEHDALFVDPTNMRHGKKPPDVSDLMPSVRKRGILVPLIVRPADEGRAGIVAGSRRWTCNGLVRAEGIDHGPLPCAILEEGDDASAIETSLIENVARRDPDEVTQWATYTRLVKEGQKVDEIATTFGLPELAVKRILALGNLLPAIRQLYSAEKIDAVTVRHLTMASKSQQRAWLALMADADAYVPTGHQLKAWLFGGQSIKAHHALFDIEGLGLTVISDLFGEDRYFADPDAFWTAQNAAVEAMKADYLAAGWPDAVIVGPSEHFNTWEHEKAPKSKGGRVYIVIRSSGEVVSHEGYVTNKEARRIEKGEQPASIKVARPEVTSTMQTYIDLHRHAAVRAAMTAHPAVALRLVVAHVIVGSSLFRITPEPQTTRNDDVRESVESGTAEADFDAKRRAALAVLGFDPERARIVEDGFATGQDQRLAGIFLRLLDLTDDAVLEVLAVVMGETMASGSAAVAAVGEHIGVDMSAYWQADAVFFELIRDKEVLVEIVRDIAGDTVAAANAKEKGKTLKKIATDHLAGAGDRKKVENWVPRWMRFAPSAYTVRGGVGSVAAHKRVAAERDRLIASAAPDTLDEPEPGRLAA